MKNNFRFFRNIFLISQSFLVFSLISCNDAEEELLKKPAIAINPDGISISFAEDSDSSYINIFRKEINFTSTTDENSNNSNDSKSDDDEFEKYNIGLIIPSENNQSSYIFKDCFFVSGKKYSYCIRSKRSSGYVYSEWTSWPTDEDGNALESPTTSFSSEDNLKFFIPYNSYLEYDDEYQTLTLQGSEILSVSGFEDFYPSICISCNGKSRVFTIEKLEKGNGIPLETKIDLRTILTDDFFGKDLSIDGLIYQKTDKTDKSCEKVFWSLNSEISVQTKDKETPESIKIPREESQDNLHDFAGFKNNSRNFVYADVTVF